MIRYPYESQWGDISCNQPFIERGIKPSTYFDWRTEGYPSEGEYLFWARHICGLACFRSVLRAWRPDAARIPMYELIRLAQESKALVRQDETVGGLYYHPFVRWIRDSYGIEGLVHPDIGPRELLKQISDEQVVLASVSSEIRYPNRPNARQGGHLVLAHQFDTDTVVLHNPSGVDETAENATINVRTFERFFAGRGVTLKRAL